MPLGPHPMRATEGRRRPLDEVDFDEFIVGIGSEYRCLPWYCRASGYGVPIPSVIATDCHAALRMEIIGNCGDMIHTTNDGKRHTTIRESFDFLRRTDLL